MKDRMKNIVRLVSIPCLLLFTVNVVIANTQLVYDGDLQFDSSVTNNTVMILKSNGFLGIGDPYPDTPLHIKGAPSGSLGVVKVEGTNQTGGYIQYEDSGVKAWMLGVSNGDPGFHFRENYTTGASRLYIQNGGNIGIGTSEPSYKLDIESDNDNQIRISNSQTSGGSNGSTMLFGLRRTDNFLLNSGFIKVQKEQQYTGEPSTIDSLMRFGVIKDENLYEAMRLTSDGRLGIGDPNPDTPLHIKGAPVGSLGVIKVEGTNQTGGYIQYEDSGVKAWMIGVSHGDQGLHFRENYTNGASRLYIQNGGKIGIGTNSPTELLTVKGTVLALKFKVTPSIADYVFDSNYILRPLEEVETFIKKNKHLPNFKSEAEYQKEGALDMGEFQRILQEVSEEQALYLIAEHNENASQAKEIRQLKDKNQLLEQRLENMEKLLEKMSGQKLPKISDKKWYQFWK